MPNLINKVMIGGNTIIDLTKKPVGGGDVPLLTVKEVKLGCFAWTRDGALIEGELTEYSPVPLYVKETKIEGEADILPSLEYPTVTDPLFNKVTYFSIDTCQTNTVTEGGATTSGYTYCVGNPGSAHQGSETRQIVSTEGSQTSTITLEDAPSTLTEDEIFKILAFYTPDGGTYYTYTDVTDSIDGVAEKVITINNPTPAFPTNTSAIVRYYVP